MIVEMFFIVYVILKLIDLYRKFMNCISWISVCYVINILIWCNICIVILIIRLVNCWKNFFYYLIELRKGLLIFKLFKIFVLWYIFYFDNWMCG